MCARHSTSRRSTPSAPIRCLICGARPGIAYDTAKLPGAKLDESWKELFEPRPEFVGKIGMLKDDGRGASAPPPSISASTTALEKPEQGQKILELLEKQKPAVKVYNSEGTVDRVGGGEVAMQLMWNGSFHRAHKKLATLAYIYPREGLGLWGDNLAIPKGAKNVENAKLFLNWMMDPKNAAEASNFPATTTRSRVPSNISTPPCAMIQR